MTILSKARELEDTPLFLKMLIYGESGAGKTRLAASSHVVDELSPVLLVDAEAGVASVVNVYPGIKVLSLSEAKAAFWRENPDDSFDYAGWLEELVDELEEDTTYKTVIIDSLSEVQNALIVSHLVNEAAQDSTKDVDLPSQRDFLKVSNLLRALVCRFRDLQKNIIFTCLEREGSGRDDSRLVPALMPSLASTVPAYMDVVGRLCTVPTEGGLERRLYTSLTPRYIAKDRRGVLPPTITNPTMEEICFYLRGEGKSAKTTNKDRILK